MLIPLTKKKERNVREEAAQHRKRRWREISRRTHVENSFLGTESIMCIFFIHFPRSVAIYQRERRGGGPRGGTDKCNSWLGSKRQTWNFFFVRKRERAESWLDLGWNTVTLGEGKKEREERKTGVEKSMAVSPKRDGGRFFFLLSLAFFFLIARVCSSSTLFDLSQLRCAFVAVVRTILFL